MAGRRKGLEERLRHKSLRRLKNGSGGRKSSILHRLICDVGTGGQIDP